MPSLTVDSLSLTPQSSWPLDPDAGILVAHEIDDRVRLAAAGAASFPASSTTSSWTGTPVVAVDFTPE